MMSKCRNCEKNYRKKLVYGFTAFIFIIFCAVMLSNVTVNAENDEVTVIIEGTKSYSYAKEMFEILNQERESQGLEKLTLDKELTEAAMQRAAEIAISFSHTRPNGNSCFTINDRMFGENISAGYSTPESSMEGFMNSEGHRENILRTSFKSVGIGCVTVNGIKYWAQCFSYYDTTAELTSLPADKDSDFSINVLCDNLQLKFAEGSELEISANKTKQLTLYSVNKEWSYGTCKITSKDLLWSSSDDNVCKVDSNGLITGVSEGTAIISCKLGSACANATITVAKSFILESDHPYENSLDNTYTLSYPNAEKIEFTFTSNTETEKSFDVIYIYDENKKLIGQYSGTELSGKTLSVDGSTVYIRLVTDDSINKYGFAIEKVNVTYPQKKLTLNSFTTSANKIDLGESIKLTALADGVNVRYKFAYYYNSKWTVIKDYSSTSVVDWKPSNSGTYKIRVFVTDGTDTIKEDINVSVNAKLLINSFTSDKYNISLGEKVNLNTSATGNNLQYKFAYTRTGTSWSVIKQYSSTSSTVWTPKYKGTYTVRVFVTDGTNTYKKDITIVVS